MTGAVMAARDLRRDGAAGQQNVTMVELFFDLVFVFAITQLSHALVADVSVAISWPLGIAAIVAIILIAVAVWETRSAICANSQSASIDRGH